MESKTPALTSLSVLDVDLTSDDLLDVNHIVNDKSVSGKRAGMGIMVGDTIYVALGSQRADGWSPANVPKGILDTSKYFSYDADRDLLIATRTIATEPSTINVGNHAVSSAGENVTFTNLATDIDWSPPWSGLKDHADQANHGATGVIPLSSRHYNTDVIQIEVAGPRAASGAVPYATSLTLDKDSSTFGQVVVVEEDIAPDDWLFYRINFGDETGDLVYQQKLTGRTLSAGDELTWWFQIPVEGYAGQTVYATMSIAKGDQDAELNHLLVRPSAADANVRYMKMMRRLFSDEDVMSGILYTTESQTIRYAATYAVDTSAGAVNLSVDSNIGYKSFVVFDADQNFNNNACTISFGAVQGDAVLQTKNDCYLFYYTGVEWRYLDMDTKNGGVV